MPQRKLKIASVEEILHELTKIALGKRVFETREKSSGEIICTPPSEGAVMKALELLGKSQQLFTDKQESEEDLKVRVSVIETDSRA